MGYAKETFLCSTCLALFLARSNLFKLAMACYWMFYILQKTKLQNVLTYKFTINQLLQMSASVIMSGAAFLNYKAGKVVLQCLAGNTKYGNFYYKVGQGYDNNHKLVQYRRQIKEIGEIYFANLLLHSTLICLLTDTLPLYEFLKVEILL